MRIRALQHLKAGIKTLLRKVPPKNALRDGDEVYVLLSNKTLRLVVKQHGRLWYGLFKDELPSSDLDFEYLKVGDIQFTNPNWVYNLSHNNFADYSANEHIDWTNASENFSTTGKNTAATYYVGTSEGVTDTFDTADGRVATVTKGIITDIS